MVEIEDLALERGLLTIVEFCRLQGVDIFVTNLQIDMSTRKVFDVISRNNIVSYKFGATCFNVSHGPDAPPRSWTFLMRTP